MCLANGTLYFLSRRTLRSGAVGERSRMVNDGRKPVDTATSQTQAKTPTVAGSDKFGGR